MIMLQLTQNVVMVPSLHDLCQNSPQRMGRTGWLKSIWSGQMVSLFMALMARFRRPGFRWRMHNLQMETLSHCIFQVSIRSILGYSRECPLFLQSRVLLRDQSFKHNAGTSSVQKVLPTAAAIEYFIVSLTSEMRSLYWSSIAVPKGL